MSHFSGANVAAAEHLTAAGTGKVRVGRKSYKLKPRNLVVAAGATGSLKLKPKLPGSARKIATSLGRGRTATAEITVGLRDEFGHVDSKKLSVDLKP